MTSLTMDWSPYTYFIDCVEVSPGHWSGCKCEGFLYELATVIGSAFNFTVKSERVIFFSFIRKKLLFQIF